MGRVLEASDPRVTENRKSKLKRTFQNPSYNTVLHIVTGRLKAGIVEQEVAVVRQRGLNKSPQQQIIRNNRENFGSGVLCAVCSEAM
jgi:hypothetical protein